MGWTAVDRDGHKMWERCDGVVLSSSDQIDALEKYESDQHKRLMENRINYDYPEDEIEVERTQFEKDHPILAPLLQIIIPLGIFGFYLIAGFLSK